MGKLQRSVLLENAYVVVALALLPALLGAYLLWDDFAQIDGRYFPDDTYYISTIARNLVSGGGFSADGVTHTNGFQPLFVFLAAPIFLLVNGSQAPLYVQSVLSLLFLPVAIVLVASILTKHCRISMLSAGLYSIFMLGSGEAIAVALNGMESTLALALIASSILLFCRSLESNRWPISAATGVSLGLLVLARIDGVFVCIAIAFGYLALKSWRKLVVCAITAMLVVLPWWIYSVITFGAVVPESGAAVKLITEFHYGNHVVSFAPLALAAEQMSAYLLSLRSSVVGCVALVAVISSSLAALMLKRDVVLLVVLISAILYLGFYVLYLPAFWFFDRYLLGAYLLFGVAGLISVKIILDHSRVLLSWRILVVGGALVLTVLQGAVMQKFIPIRELYARGMDARGYAASAAWLLDRVPIGAPVGSFQTGALSYFGQGKIRVFNLDGVVDKAAYRASKARSMDAYMVEHSIRFFYDWEFNVRYMDYLARAGVPLEFAPLGTAPSDSSDRFSLYRVQSVIESQARFRAPD